MNLSIALNVVGLVLVFAGGLLLFLGTPPDDGVPRMILAKGRDDAEGQIREKLAASQRRRRLTRSGAGLGLLGVVAQLLSYLSYLLAWMQTTGHC